MTPVDLVDGDGDELVVVRTVAHASPRAGNDLKIWKPGATRPVELVRAGFKVADSLQSMPFGCAQWRFDLVVDPSERKPRRLQLRGRAAYQPFCCLDGTDQVEQLRRTIRGRTLRWSNGSYVIE